LGFVVFVIESCEMSSLLSAGSLASGARMAYCRCWKALVHRTLLLARRAALGSIVRNEVAMVYIRRLRGVRCPAGLLYPRRKMKESRCGKANGS
jgi:hypothetical protein